MEDSFNKCVSLHEIISWREAVDNVIVKGVIGVLYGSCFVLGIIGNLAVIYSLPKFKNVKFRVRKIFILSLAMADLMIVIFCLPVTGTTYILRRWVFGDLMCKTSTFLQAVSVFCSSAILTVIAVDRYLLIVHQNNNPSTMIKAASAVGFSAALAAFLASPLIIFSVSQKQNEVLCFFTCQEMWTSDKWRHFYSILAFGLQYVVPSGVTTFCYYSIVQRIREQSRKLSRHTQQPLLYNTECDRRRQVTTKMTTLMVASFVLLWMPLNVFNLLIDAGLLNAGFYDTLLGATFHLVAMMSAVCNPIIYSWFNPSFRYAVMLPLRIVSRADCATDCDENEAPRTVRFEAAMMNAD